MTPSIAVAIEKYAKKYGFEPAALKAVAFVESGGTFFWTVDGKALPPIRPEVHKFYQFLSGKKRDEAVRQGLAHPQMNGISIPNSWAGRYDFFERMCRIDEAAAIKATSWGIGQVMGFHYDFLGFASPQELKKYACSGIEGQMELMCRFINKNPAINAALKNKNWAAFAKGYNGPAYAKNKYDKKLKEAYEKFLKSPIDGDVYLIQERLQELGFYTGKLDGIDGPLTAAAVKKFQGAAGLVVDGNVSTLTLEKIDEYLAAQSSKNARSKIPTIGAAGAAATTVVKPVVEAITSGDLVDTIDKTRSIAEAAHKLLAMVNLPSVISAVVMAAVVGFSLYVLLKNVRDDDQVDYLDRAE